VKDDLQQFLNTNSSECEMRNNSLGLVTFGPWKGKEKLEDTKEVIRVRQPRKDRQCNGQTKTTKEKTTIYKTLKRKIKNEQHESH
jgi:hypothetical protein